MGEFTDELILPAKRTSRGELGVAVAGAGVGGMTVHQHFNIVTPDPAGVRRSMPQVLRKAAMGIRGANR
jgi:phage-related minor tail protein